MRRQHNRRMLYRQLNVRLPEYVSDLFNRLLVAMDADNNAELVSWLIVEEAKRQGLAEPTEDEE